jgi:CheY-like chemotaxis protein
VKDLSESRVLIVDDAKENIDILVNALRDEYKLSVALDGVTALRSVEKSPPDLVLLDIMMPGLDTRCAGNFARASRHVKCRSCFSARSSTSRTRRTASRSAAMTT